jgi:hypothetical protein
VIEPPRDDLSIHPRGFASFFLLLEIATTLDLETNRLSRFDASGKLRSS